MATELGKNDRETLPAMQLEANLFALELLMPVAFVRADLEKNGGLDISKDEDFVAMAKRFRVPSHVMAMRVGQLLGEGLLT